MENDEMKKAQLVKPGGDTIFGKIVRGEMKTNFVYEDDKCVAFEDINPMAPVHILVVPRKPISQLSVAQEEDDALLGHLLFVAQKIAKDKGLANGFRIIINDGPDGGQTVYHLHVHVMGGRELRWPPG